MQREMFQLYLPSGKTQVIYQACNSVSEAGIFMTEPYWSVRTGRKQLGDQNSAQPWHAVWFLHSSLL